MKLYYDNPMKELALLLQQAAETNASIIVTKAEMKALVTHGDASKVFPTHFAAIKNRMLTLEQKMAESKRLCNSPTASQATLQEQWDRQTVIERQMRMLEAEVPSEILADNGVTIKVSINA